MNQQKKRQVIAFLNTKLRNKEEDPDERWTTTWNDYLWRLKMFYIWLYNFKIKEENQINYSIINNWNTPNFVNINKKKKTKRLSPYNESEIWDRDELLSIVKYEPYIPLNSEYLITFFKDRDKKNNQRIWLSAK